MRPVKPFLHILLQFRIRGRDFDVGQATYYLRLSSASPPGVVGVILALRWCISEHGLLKLALTGHP